MWMNTKTWNYEDSVATEIKLASSSFLTYPLNYKVYLFQASLKCIYIRDLKIWKSKLYHENMACWKESWSDRSNKVTFQR